MNALSKPVPVTGHIVAAARAGLPGPLLIPCSPHHERPSEWNHSPGKTPCRLTVHGEWGPIKDWRKAGAMPAADLLKCSQAGANCGLILGVPFKEWQYLFLDIDTEPGIEEGSRDWKIAQAISTKALATLQASLGLSAMWVRLTRPGRAGVLLRLPAAADVGRKAVLKMVTGGDTKRGKIELLANGQQAVVAGLHVFGNGTQIRWYRTDAPGDTQRAPAMDEALPVLESRAQLDAAVDSVVEVLKGYGIAFSGKSLAQASAETGAPVDDLHMMPPSVNMLVDLLDSMPHDKRTERDEWVKTMRNVAGCCAALQRADKLSDADRVRIEDAAVRWSTRWTEGTFTEQESREKWESDFARSPNTDVPCWSLLVDRAIALGDQSLQAESLRLRADEIEADFAPTQEAPAEVARQLSRPQLVVRNGDLVGTIRDLAVHLAMLPTLFERDGVPVKVTQPADGDPEILELSAGGVVIEADRACRLVVKNKEGNLAATTLPKRAADLYLALNGERGLPHLYGIAAAPLLSNDGCISTATGYDPATYLWCHSVPPLTVPDDPTRADAESALLTLRHVLRGFCFADNKMTLDPEWRLPVTDTTVDPAMAESTAIVALLTAVCRSSLPLAPALLVTAPGGGNGAGTGKGLLVRVIAAIAFGFVPSAFTPGNDGHEMDKRIVADLIAAKPVVFLDNVNSTAIQSNTLASAITEEKSQQRDLGRSRMVQVRPTAWIAVTGNGVSVTEDLLRRFLEVLLNPKMEDPGSRPFPAGFIDGVKARRAELLSAALIIWKWGRLHRGELRRGRMLGSFAPWCEWVRDPLLTLGCRDPVEAIQAAKAQDPKRIQIAEMMGAWFARFGSKRMKAADVTEAYELHAVLDPGGLGRQKIAASLKSLAGTVGGGFVLHKHESLSARNPAEYSVEEIAEAEPIQLSDRRGSA